MPMTALPQSLTPAVAAADAMDGGVAFNGSDTTPMDGAAAHQVARRAIVGLTASASSSTAPGSAETALPSIDTIIPTVVQQPVPQPRVVQQPSPSLATLADAIRSLPSDVCSYARSGWSLWQGAGPAIPNLCRKQQRMLTNSAFLPLGKDSPRQCTVWHEN